jgi:hypothetical protein
VLRLPRPVLVCNGQQGISTISIILALDAVIFSPGTGVSIVHLTDKLAQNIVEKHLFAYDLLPA